MNSKKEHRSLYNFCLNVIYVGIYHYIDMLIDNKYFSCNKVIGRCTKGDCWDDKDCDVDHACVTQKTNISKCIRTKGCIEK